MLSEKDTSDITLKKLLSGGLQDTHIMKVAVHGLNLHEIHFHDQRPLYLVYSISRELVGREAGIFIDAILLKDLKHPKFR